MLFLIMSRSTCLLRCYIANRPALRVYFQQMNTVTSGCTVIYFIRSKNTTLLEGDTVRLDRIQTSDTGAPSWHQCSTGTHPTQLKMRRCLYPGECECGPSSCSVSMRLPLKCKDRTIAPSSVSSMDIHFSFMFCIEVNGLFLYWMFLLFWGHIWSVLTYIYDRIVIIFYFS